METWFVASGRRISEVVVLREKPASLVIREKEFRITWDAELNGVATDEPERFREKTVRKQGAYENYFSDWDSAHLFLLEEAERDLTAARVRLAAAQGHLGNIKGLKKPEAA